MKYDKKIEKQVKNIKCICDEWLGWVMPMNQCAYTDRILEDIENQCVDFLNTMKLREKEFKKLEGNQ